MSRSFPADDFDLWCSFVWRGATLSALALANGVFQHEVADECRLDVRQHVFSALHWSRRKGKDTRA